MIGVLVAATVLTPPQIGQRAKALEIPIVLGMRYRVATISDDGKTLLDANQTMLLDAWDTRTGTDLVNENVFLCKTSNGKTVVLTDSQFPHVRDSARMMGAPAGKVLNTLGNGEYLVNVGADNKTGPMDYAVAIVRPGKRGLNSNTVLFTHKSRIGMHIWPTGGRGVVTADHDNAAKQWTFKKWNGDKAVATYNVRPGDKGASLTIAGFDPQRMRSLHQANTSEIWIEFDLRTKATKRVPIPAYQGTLRDRSRPTAFYAGGRLLASWAPPYGSDQLHVWSGGKWRHVGSYAVLAVSPNGKRLLLRKSETELYVADATRL